MTEPIPRDEPDRSTKPNGAPPAEAPRILRGVVDQHGGRWLCYGTAAQHCWFALSDLHSGEKAVFQRISAQAGVVLLTSRRQNDFKTLVEGYAAFETGLVAGAPGWVGSSFAFGDGSVGQLEDAEDVIVAFAGDTKFRPHGSMSGWLAGVGAVIARQPLLLFAISYALVGPLLRFAPPGTLNPQVEIVGPRESGKSTLGVLAMSVHAGDRDSNIGGGITWDLTTNAFDLAKAAHAGALLFIDEGNLAGLDAKSQRDLIEKAIFKGATKGGKQRYTDTAPAPNVDVALLSTSNVALAELVPRRQDIAEAMRSRMLTLKLNRDRPYRILDFVPDGFASGRDAIEHLRREVDLHYGVAARAFVEVLVREAADEERLRGRIAKLGAQFTASLSPQDRERLGSTRLEQLFAMTYAAGRLARTWGVLPDDWGPLKPALRKVVQLVDGPPTPTAGNSSPVLAIDRIRHYVEQHRGSLVREQSIHKPLTLKALNQLPGILRHSDSRSAVLIAPTQFRRAFPDGAALLKQLRDEGCLRTENGRSPKLSIKAPKHISSSGRIYFVIIGDKTGV